MTQSFNNATSVRLASRIVIRKLTEADEEEFIKLLRLVYEDSYSYSFLYEKGGLSSLINSNQLISYGEFDNNNSLLAHTAFLHKEKESDYVESGCSFRVSGGLKEFKASTSPKAWQEELQKLALDYAFIHQHNSTVHVLAQRYAERLMNAKYCGLILGYSENEKVRGMPCIGGRMHALIMTTVLQPSQQFEKTVYVPEWIKEWLGCIYSNLGIPRRLQQVNLKARTGNPAILLNVMETNPYIGLQRRLIEYNPNTTELGLTPSLMRTDLIHLPIEDSKLVSSVFNFLLEEGYVPCGVRPHIHQSDELIFQKLSDYKQIIANLFAEIHIANVNTRREVERWQALALQIM